MGFSALNLYRIASELIEPLLPLWLAWRVRCGKEDKARLGERYGYASKARPKGALLWIHAASVGEANSVLPLMSTIHQRFPALALLMTTGTKTSAELMKTKLPASVIHQYAPLDTPEATHRFMRHWKPEIAFFVESELWPNLLTLTDRYQAFIAVINGRMSARSLASWQKYPAMIRTLLDCVNVVFAQSEEDAQRYRALGAKQVLSLGNVKYDADALSCNESELFALKRAVGDRPLWLAASTHPGEEEWVLRAHQSLKARWPNVLTLIAPRHASRGGDIVAQLRDHKIARRSLRQPIMPDTEFYIADTMGELGLFYRLSEIAFMGGSLIHHGGQNPLEPARLAAAIITGPHTHNFAEMIQEMQLIGACHVITRGDTLAPAVAELLSDTSKRTAMGDRAKEWAALKRGATDALLAKLSPVLEKIA